MNKLSTEDKYKLYEASVQNPETDIEFINKEYKAHFKRLPLTLREDFCGTGALACHWVAQSQKHTAFGIDLDPEPIAYGKEHHYASLTKEEQSRMSYLMANVLADGHKKVDVAVAFNFSYFIFKQRKLLLEYFQKVRSGINEDGIFVIDYFGGTEGFQPLIEEKELDHHSYFWDCESFNPLTHDVLYHIHFETHDDKKRYEKVFTYDWRMWTSSELIDLLKEAGFSEVKTYWEGVDEDGEGDGVFENTLEAENCESWVTYLVAVK